MGIEGAGTWRPDILFVRTSALQRPAGWTMAQPVMLRYKIQSKGTEKKYYNDIQVPFKGRLTASGLNCGQAPSLGNCQFTWGSQQVEKGFQNVKQSNAKSLHLVHKRQCGCCYLWAGVQISLWTGWLDWKWLENFVPYTWPLSRMQLPSWDRAIRFSRLQRHFWGQFSSAASTNHHEIKHAFL